MAGKSLYKIFYSDPEKYKSIATVIAAMMIFSSCAKNADIADDVTTQTEQTIQTAAFSENAAAATVQMSVPETTADSEGVTETSGEVYPAENYIYSPPEEAAAAAEFTVDRKIYKLEFDTVQDDLPSGILSEFRSYLDSIKNDGEELGTVQFCRYDINSDGIDDYFLQDNVLFSPGRYVRLYASNSSGFDAVDIPLSKYEGNDYILSSQTNGYNDYIGCAASNGDLALIKFDGKNSYIVSDTLGTDYTWEYLDDCLLRISCYGGKENQYAFAKPLHDTDILENALLYSSYPDGTPKVCDGSTFDFYVKLTDKAPEKENDFWIGVLEIQFIEKDSSL